MIRRKLTLKRVDPWTVLKFGFVVNVALLLVGLLAFWILWVTIRRLGLIEQFCGSVGTIVLDLQECSINGGNVFRTVLFLGLLAVVVQTGLVVFGAFLYNLISDLTGGLTFSFLDESGDAVMTSSSRSTSTSSSGSTRTASAAGAGAAAGTSATGGSGPSGGSSGSSGSTGSSVGTSQWNASGTPKASWSSSGTAPRSATRTASDDEATTRTGSESQPAEDARREDETRERPAGGSLWGDPSRSND